MCTHCECSLEQQSGTRDVGSYALATVSTNIVPGKGSVCWVCGALHRRRNWIAPGRAGGIVAAR